MKQMSGFGVGIMCAGVVASVLGCSGAAVKGEGGELTKGQPVATKQLPFVRHTDSATLWVLAQALCPDSARAEGAEVSCGVCPGQTVGASPDAHELDGEEIGFRAALVGDLRGDGTRMALLDSEGCEAHASNYGGHFLMIEEGGKWRQLRYTSGDRVRDCAPIWFHGQASMLCGFYDMHMGFEFGGHDIVRLAGDELVHMGGPVVSCNVGGCAREQEVCWKTTEAVVRDVTGDGEEELVWTGSAEISKLKAGEDPAILEQCMATNEAPYDTTQTAIAQVYTKQGDKLVPVNPAHIKDAGLRAQVEAAAALPAPEH